MSKESGDKYIYLIVYIIVISGIFAMYKYTSRDRDDNKDKQLENKLQSKLSSSYKPSGVSGTLLRNITQVRDEGKKFASSSTRKLLAEARIELPKNFNGKEVWKDFMSPISDQGTCGSCWAHSSTHALADRFAIMSLGQIRFTPSPYELVVCAKIFTDIQKQWGNVSELELMDDYLHGKKVDPNNKLQSAACEGSSLYVAMNALYTDGVPDISCFPDRSNQPPPPYNIVQTTPDARGGASLPYCHTLETLDFDVCVDKITAAKKYRCKTSYNIGNPEKDTIDQLEYEIMFEIYKGGPIMGGFMVFSDFDDPSRYDGTTIYRHPDKNAPQNGGHAIRIVGWGEEMVGSELVKYWWIANSWGPNWGIDGYFRMERGIPECQLEQNVVAMIPDFPGMKIWDPKLIPIETEKEIFDREFSGHYLDPQTGLYTTAIEKIKSCKLLGDTRPIIDPSFPLPDYTKFNAGEVLEYIRANNIENVINSLIPLQPLHTCATDIPSPKSQQPLQDQNNPPSSQQPLQDQNIPPSSQQPPQQTSIAEDKRIRPHPNSSYNIDLIPSYSTIIYITLMIIGIVIAIVL